MIVLPIALLGIFFGYRSRGLSMDERLILAGGSVGLIAVIIVAILAVSRISITASELRVRNPIGVTRRYRREDLAFAVLATQYQASPQVARAPMVLVATNRGRSAFRMNGHYWTQESMQSILAGLNLARVDVVQTPLTPVLFDRRYPKLLPFMERRPFVSALLLMVVFVLLIVGIVFVVAAG